MSEQQIQLFTDGSCLGNPGPGGWAALLRIGAEEQEIKGGAKETTNNQMELKAVIEGLKLLGNRRRIEIFSDSKYVIDAFRQDWISGWLARGWKTAAKKPVKNQDLWKELIALAEGCDITWHWVKGHSGHPENERVDQLALSEAQRHAMGG